MGVGRALRVATARSALTLLHKAYSGRLIEWRGLRLYIPRGCFLPRYTISSDLLADIVEPQGRVLDIGCGPGTLAIYVAKRWGLPVVGYDPDTRSVAVARLNARLNGVENLARFTTSILRIPHQSFDTAISNPPYLPLNPKNEMDKLWCCGTDYRTLRSILLAVRRALKRGGVFYIALSSLTPLSYGLAMAKALGFHVERAAYRRSPIDTVYVIKFVLRDVMVS